MTVFDSFISCMIVFLESLIWKKVYIKKCHFSVFIHVKQLNIFRRNMLLTNFHPWCSNFVVHQKRLVPFRFRLFYGKCWLDFLRGDDITGWGLLESWWTVWRHRRGFPPRRQRRRPERATRSELRRSPSSGAVLPGRRNTRGRRHLPRDPRAGAQWGGHDCEGQPPTPAGRQGVEEPKWPVAVSLS